MFPVSRRKTNTQGELRGITFKAPPELYRALRMRAAETDKDVSEVIRTALITYLSKA